MSVFSKIRDAILGGGRKPAGERPQIPAGWAGGPPVGTPGAPVAPDATATPIATEVDVEQVLKDMLVAKGNPDLNWRTSIVDLMKLVGIDSTLDNRKALAEELGYTGRIDGSVEMNLWLHREVMRQLAANGGKVPSNLTD